MKIQKNYFDALFYANSTSTEDKKLYNFHISPAEFKILLKLIHYSTQQSNITWKSEEISKHTSMNVGVIDKSIQRLKQKGYINTSTYNTTNNTKHRTIFINWDRIEEVNNLYIQSLNQIDDLTEDNTSTDIIPPILEETSSDEIYVEELIVPTTYKEYDDSDTDLTEEEYQMCLERFDGDDVLFRYFKKKNIL